MIDINVLKDLTNAFGPSGFEEDVVRAVRDHCTGMSLTNDAMNNVYARIGGNANGKKPALPVAFWEYVKEPDYGDVSDKLNFKLHPLLHTAYYRKQLRIQILKNVYS